MTITINFNDENQIQDLKDHFSKLSEFLDIPDECIPVEICESDDSLKIYICDSFAKYSYDFLFSLLTINISKGETSKYRMEQLARKFRRSAEEYFMAPLT